MFPSCLLNREIGYVLHNYNNQLIIGCLFDCSTMTGCAIALKEGGYCGILLVHCMLFILSCSSEICNYYNYLYLNFLVSRSEIIQQMQYVLLQIHVASHRWQFDSCIIKTSAGARTGIVRCTDGHRSICYKLFESPLRLSVIVRHHGQ